jgi:2TM domain
MNDQTVLRKAQLRAGAKYGFYIHLTVYLLVNALLIAINLVTSREHYWFMWPLTCWGIGVLFHALGAFVFAGDSSLRDKLVEREMKKLG